jgi:hypothetical protein
MTVKRKAAVRPMLVSIAVPYAEPAAATSSRRGNVAGRDRPVTESGSAYGLLADTELLCHHRCGSRQRGVLTAVVPDQTHGSGLQLFIDLLRYGAHPPGLKQERHQTWGASCSRPSLGADVGPLDVIDHQDDATTRVRTVTRRSRAECLAGRGSLGGGVRGIAREAAEPHRLDAGRVDGIGPTPTGRLRRRRRRPVQ